MTWTNAELLAVKTARLRSMQPVADHQYHAADEYGFCATCGHGPRRCAALYDHETREANERGLALLMEQYR